MFGFRQALGIDCGDDAWRIVALRATGRGYILTCAATLSPEEASAENAAATLALLLKETGGARKRAVGALPTTGCAFKTASLPPGKPAELAQVVRFEAENQFPLPLQELVWGYTLTPEPSGRQHAVITGARRSLIDKYLLLLRQAGAAPAAMLPAALAAASAIRKPDGACVVVLAGLTWSDLCLYEGERLLSCRSVLAGNPEGDGWAERIAREIRPWVIAHEGLRQLSLIGAVTEPMAEALAQTTELSVMIGDPWQGISDPHQLLPALQGTGASFATAIGLAKAALHRPELNLFPAELLQAARQQRRMAWVLAGLVCALALFTPVAMAGQHTLQQRQAKVARLEQQVRQVRHTMGVAPNPVMVTAGQIITTMHAPESRPLEILRALSSQLPAGVSQPSSLMFGRRRSTARTRRLE